MTETREKLVERLPAPLHPLIDIAYNFRWSWSEEAQSLFEDIDATLWVESRENPVRMLLDLGPRRMFQLAEKQDFLVRLQSAHEDLNRYMSTPGAFGSVYPKNTPRVAYFSAEFAIAKSLRVFSGGLGVLAGDHLKSASDLDLPLVGVGLLYKEGYFTQEIDENGQQHATYRQLKPHRLPISLATSEGGKPLKVKLFIEDREVTVQAWKVQVGRIPLLLLDTDIEENSAEDRQITDRLYGGDRKHRLLQEMVLGIGGMKLLSQWLGDQAVGALHLNEGHAAFAAIERARQFAKKDGSSFNEALNKSRGSVVFTTHTPVPAGHDYFDIPLLQAHIYSYLKSSDIEWGEFLNLGQKEQGSTESFCMTVLAVRTSAQRNGVSKLHGQVSREMWQGLWPEERRADNIPIGFVTNGVHMPTWVSRPMGQLYKKAVGPRWPEIGGEAGIWKHLFSIPNNELWAARNRNRAALIQRVRESLIKQMARHGESSEEALEVLSPDALTIVFARRFATYKRATLLLSDEDRLMKLLNDKDRPVQFVFAGKAHPADEPGQEFIRKLHEFGEQKGTKNKFIFLENYDVEIARALVQGADVWLNTPRRPYEASGTSGMKASGNGGLNLSILDGWWAEAWTDHNALDISIGWAIPGTTDEADSATLYNILEKEVVPTFFDRNEEGIPEEWLGMVKSNLSQLTAYFSTHRMVAEYSHIYYGPALRAFQRSF